MHKPIKPIINLNVDIEKIDIGGLDVDFSTFPRYIPKPNPYQKIDEGREKVIRRLLEDILGRKIEPEDFKRVTLASRNALLGRLYVAFDGTILGFFQLERTVKGGRDVVLDMFHAESK